jgi:mRNA-degrading endonuclease RelE of RelBE toxin-antitoxin system
MSLSIVPDPKVEATLRKMWLKDSVRFNQIEKKLRELAENPEIGKPLKTAQGILAPAHRALCPHVQD